MIDESQFNQKLRSKEENGDVNEEPNMHQGSNNDEDSIIRFATLICAEKLYVVIIDTVW